nr:MAG TPA: hypothetical protein [Caudoviricetes sp.]
MEKERNLDRRRKYYLILDCETATLPYASNFGGDEKKAISIAKPLIYDLGWTVCDAKGKIYRKRSYLITEIFSVPSVFNTAYYKEKRPQYLEKLKNGSITLKTWKEATEILERDLLEVQAVGAYNAAFDFKKAIPFTEKYIEALYSSDFQRWEEVQEKVCANIARGKKAAKRDGAPEFDPCTFTFRGISYPIFDIWGLACKHLLNTDEYRTACLANNWITSSGKYYQTSAEKAFAYLMNDREFLESHTAIEDAEIESAIFGKVVEKVGIKGIEFEIMFFPFRMVGIVK